MNSEPFFLVDEELEEFQKDINSFMLELKNPRVKQDALILRTFAEACANSFRKPEYKICFLPPTKEVPKVERIVKKIPVGYSVWPIPKPNSKEVEKFEVKARFREVKIEKVIEPSHRELITDKITNKVLATAEANDKYIVNQPKLDQRDIEVVNKVLSEYPQNMKEAWELIKKEGISDVDATNVKYYVASELFAFGKIEPLLHDLDVKAIICDGVGEFVKVKYRGKELRTNFIFEDKEVLNNYIYKISRKLGKEINEENPIVDVVNRGFRIHLILGIRTSSKFVFSRVE